MPLIYNNTLEKELGIRKIWIHPMSDETKAESFSYACAITLGHSKFFEGLTLNTENWYM